MGKVTLSLTDEAEKKLRRQAKSEKRSMSKQVEYLLERYDNAE